MIIHVCDRCKKKIDSNNCEEVKYDEREPLELCDECYYSFLTIMETWLNYNDYNSSIIIFRDKKKEKD